MVLSPEQMIYLLIACVGGAAGGLVYWSIAGRSAGVWRIAQS
jgi:hypothetical protein